MKSLLRTLQDTYLAVPILMAVVGTVASAIAAVQVARVSTAKDKERFEQMVVQAHDAIAGRLDTYVAVLRAGAGFIESHDGTVDRDEFRAFVSSLQLRRQYPGIQGVGYSIRLPGRSADVPVQALAAYGVPQLRVYPPGWRNEIHSIIHLEPMDRRNQAALGYDMFSEPVRRNAMERARDTGRPAASGRVHLVQELDESKQAGFLIYAPVYEGGDVPTTLADRRTKLQGFIYSPFRADDLMRGIFDRAPRPRLHLEIYDREPQPETLIHRSPGSGTDSARYTATRTLDIAGRQWTVQYSTRPEFDLSSSQSFAPFVLLGGLVATLIGTLLAYSQARAKRSADTAAATLRVSARKLEVLHATASRLSAELNADRVIQAVTDAGRELAGAEIGAFFYTVVNSDGESLQLFSLSGAPREAFAGFGIPRKTLVFGPTFAGEGPIRADDITADPRFGKNAPYKGFPAGHWPVRSYLAVPVVSRSAEVMGALFFGHSQIGIFTAEAERSIVALAGHAAIALDNARLFQASQDEIAARKKVEEHQKLLLAELNHRVKNTLATVQSIAAQTLRSSATPEAFKHAFERRLIALSEAHNLLSLANWRGVMLHDLVTRELTPHGMDDPARVAIAGDQVWLPPAVAVSIGMALHELATNAARHGALGSPKGRVEVSWTVSSTSDERRLVLTWQESGGPPVREPQRRGFGSRMIEHGLKHDLQGEAKLYFESTGVRCVVEALLPAEAQAA